MGESYRGLSLFTIHCSCLALVKLPNSSRIIHSRTISYDVQSEYLEAPTPRHLGIYYNSGDAKKQESSSASGAKCSTLDGMQEYAKGSARKAREREKCLVCCRGMAATSEVVT